MKPYRISFIKADTAFCSCCLHETQELVTWILAKSACDHSNRPKHRKTGIFHPPFTWESGMAGLANR